MFYGLVMRLLKILLFIINGRTKVIGKENLPDEEKYVLVAPHKSLLDPVFIAIAAYPHRFSFMAKKELFEVPVFSWIIRHLNAFPVDRKKPGVSSIKTPVNHLKNNELKGGAVTIARLGKSKIVPAVYYGPLTIKDVFLRKKAAVSFGEPFEVKRKIDGVEDINSYYAEKIQENFETIQKQLEK